MTSAIQSRIIEDEQGKPKTMHPDAVKFVVMRVRPGKPGRPGKFYMEGKLVTVDIDARDEDLAFLPSGTYRFVPVDKNDQRVGDSEVITIEHIDDGPEDADGEAPGTASAGYAELQKVNDRLQTENRELHETLLKAMEILGKAMEQVTKAQCRGDAPRGERGRGRRAHGGRVARQGEREHRS